jgi:hypothetical protein
MRSTQVVSSVLPVFVVHGIISQSSLQELGPRVPVLEDTAVCPSVLPDRVKACVRLFTEMHRTDVNLNLTWKLIPCFLSLSFIQNLCM